MIRTRHFCRHLPLSLALVLVTGGSLGDTLHHKDGSTIKGKILIETQDYVKIDTKYGALTYDKGDLPRIERDPAMEGVATPAPTAPATPVNYSTSIPAGPVNPFAPPQLQPIVLMRAKGITPPPETLPPDHPASASSWPAMPIPAPAPVAPVAPPGQLSPGTSRPAGAPNPAAAMASLSGELNALKTQVDAEKAGAAPVGPEMQKCLNRVLSTWEMNQPQDIRTALGMMSMVFANDPQDPFALKIEVDPAVQCSIQGTWSQTPFQQILNDICQKNQLQWKVAGPDTIRVSAAAAAAAPPAPAAPAPATPGQTSRKEN